MILVMRIELQNYNYLKSWTTWIQKPWNSYTARFKTNLLYAFVAPCMLPAYGLALVGRFSCKLLALCKPEVRRTAAAVISKALQDTRFNARAVPQGPIRHGNGEYLVFKRDQNGVRPLTEQEYGSVHQHIQSCHLWTSAYYGYTETERKRVLMDPYGHLVQKVKAVDPQFEVAFVPNVIYEMHYVEAALKEELAWLEKTKSNQMCATPTMHNISSISLKDDPHQIHDFASCARDGLPFHAPSYGPNGSITTAHLKETLNHAGLQNLHHRMNAGLIDFIRAESDPGKLTYTHLEQLAQRQIANFKTYAQGANSPVSQKIANLQQDDCLYTHFHFPHMLAFTNPKVERVVTKALRLECSALAHTHAFFYRGSVRKNDRLYGVTGGAGPMTLSLGATLFAGIIRDKGACALEYSTKREALIYPVKKSTLVGRASPIDHLPSSTILQLNGIREHFHARFNLDRSSPEAQRASYKAFNTLRRQVLFLDTPARPQQV